MSATLDNFLTKHLKLWKDEGVPAPMNELQSIAAWLSVLGSHGVEETKERMRARMLLLMHAANDLDKAGPAAVEEAGIYEHRPDIRPKDAP